MDITERKNAEAELQWNKSFLELMSNSSPLGFLVVDNRSDDILYFNHRFCKIWEIQHIEEQMKRGELKNNDIIPHCLPVLADIPAFAESCKPLQFEENRIVLEDEIAFTENRTIRRFTTQIRGENDEYYGRFYIFEDITERKLAEIEIRKAKNEAEKANYAKSEFLSRMSHELRTPMNSILGFAQLLEMSELNSKQKKGITHILNNGKHLLDLINEVLDVSGIEDGRQILTPEPLKLTGIINEVIDSIHVAAGKRKVSVEYIDSPDGSLLVFADKRRMKQVLINLLSNAIKYNKEGGSVIIESRLQPGNVSGNPLIRISISDTGIGIKPEDISKLFQAFERIGAEKTNVEGTGLGLMVVKKLTEAMGGTVGVESESNNGSTFWIELPLAENNHPESRIANGGLAPELIVAKHSGTILYIEDNLSSIELVEVIMGEYRPELRLVTSIYGKETVKLAIKHNPFLILLDLDLPDIKGIEILEKLLAEPSTKEIPVVIVSADAMPFQIEKLMKAGAANYLTKPLNVVEFMKSIDLYIK
jgi:signal transduction histidine kinase/CheY-like chemotaxis protein